MKDARVTCVDALRRELAQREGFRPAADRPLIGAGAACLDRLLSAGGLRPGSLVEYLAPQGKHGAAALALMICDRQRRFYAPTAAAWGLDLKSILLVRPANEAEELWALDQALRCLGVGAAWVMCGPLAVRDFRRLQLVAECGGTLGLFIRPVELRGRPTWADVQWLVEPQSTRGGWRLQVELVWCRGGTGGGRVQLEFDEEQNTWLEANDSHAALGTKRPTWQRSLAWPNAASRSARSSAGSPLRRATRGAGRPARRSTTYCST